MAEEEEDGHGKKGKEKPKKKKSNMVPAIVVALGMIVGGKMMGGKSAAPATAAGVLASGGAAAEGEAMDCAKDDILKPKKEAATFYADTTTINLANGKLLKVGLELSVAAALNTEVFKTEKEANKANSVLVSLITGRDMAEFSSPQGLEQLREKVESEVRPMFECNVIEVKFNTWLIG